MANAENRYKNELALELTRAELAPAAEKLGLRLANGTTGRHGKIVTIKKPGAGLMDGEVILVRDDGQLFVQSEAKRIEIRELLQLSA